MSETLKHDAAVQYTLSKNDTTLKLPEKYNGLGYQNLISMVFDLMRFRDDWMREGKAKQATRDSDRAIEPLHIVLIEEPEAHLHVQVQQVFIRKNVLLHWLTPLEVLWMIKNNRQEAMQKKGLFAYLLLQNQIIKSM